MKTTIYISRHSLTQPLNYLNENESIYIKNIKTPLSVQGEENARSMSNLKELQDVDIVYSSNYSRAISTAKYIAFKNKLDINIDYRFGERKFGINSWDELPENFEIMQLFDEDYKMKNGESRKEVTERMRKAIFEIIDNNSGKKIYITSHATAMIDLFISFGKIERKEDGFSIIINDKEILNNNFKWNEHSPELFKLEFENKKLINIEYIRIENINL